MKFGGQPANKPLDGEFPFPTGSAPAFPSGDGIPGTSFQYCFQVQTATLSGRVFDDRDGDGTDDDGPGNGIRSVRVFIDQDADNLFDAGEPEELYVWPYFFAVPLDGLTPRQRVEMFRIVTAGDYEEMKSYGTYIFYRVGITPANLAVLKNGRARAIRFSTLEAICRVLECQPGDLLEWVEE